MDTYYHITETKDLLTIKIIPKLKPIVQFGFILEGLLYIGSSIYFANSIIQSIYNKEFNFLFFVLYCVIHFLVGKKYLQRVFSKETVFVTRNDITVIEKYLGITKKLSLLIIGQINAEFVDQENFTAHPLEGNSIDYTGFGTFNKEIQLLIKDGSIELSIDDSSIRFGKDIASWEYDEIIRRIEGFLGYELKMKSPTLD